MARTLRLPRQEVRNSGPVHNILQRVTAQRLSWLLELQRWELDTRTEIVRDLVEEDNTLAAAEEYKAHIRPLAQSMERDVDKLADVPGRPPRHPAPAVTVCRTFHSLASAFMIMASAHPCVTMGPQRARALSDNYFGKASQALDGLMSLHSSLHISFDDEAATDVAWRTWLKRTLVRWALSLVHHTAPCGGQAQLMFIRIQNADDPRDIDQARLMSAFRTLLPTMRDKDVPPHVDNFMRAFLDVLGAVKPELALHAAESFCLLYSRAESEAVRSAAGDLQKYSGLALDWWETDNEPALEAMALQDTRTKQE